MFEYFRGDAAGTFRWNQGVMRAISMGAEISEVDEACQPLLAFSDRSALDANEAWVQSWLRLAERMERLATEDLDRNGRMGASRKYLRAAIYHITGEQFAPMRDPRKLEAYERQLSAFRRGVELADTGVEFVEITVEGANLPALFVPAATSAPAPCVIFFNGLESHKEMAYLFNAAGLTARGISLLLVDHHGSGAALRLLGLPARHDTEAIAGPCVDYLEGRDDVDGQRIGILGTSLGGYYAPRAAAFEPRLKACVAWGGSYDWAEVARKRTARPQREQIEWVFGTSDPAELDRRLSRLTLAGVAPLIRCPLLVVHGENDRQTPLEQARRMIAAATGSSRAELKVFTLADGGAEHCQVDNRSMGADYIHHWLAQALGTAA